MHDVPMQAIVLGMLTGLILILVPMALRLSFRNWDLGRRLSIERHQHFLTKAARDGLEAEVRHLRKAVTAAYERGKAEATRGGIPSRRLKPRLPGQDTEYPNPVSDLPKTEFPEPVLNPPTRSARVMVKI